jgi:hypothetical protein
MFVFPCYIEISQNFHNLQKGKQIFKKAKNMETIRDNKKNAFSVPNVS